MQLSEKEIEDFIFKDLSVDNGYYTGSHGFVTQFVRDHNKAFLEGWNLKAKWLRQVDLGPYGRLDIVGYYRFQGMIFIEILELKAVPIRADDFDQILRYERAILDYLTARFPLSHLVVNNYLVGRGYDSGHYINNNVNVSVTVIDYTIEGLQFDQHVSNSNWHRSNAKDFDFTKSLHNAEKVHGYR